MTRDVIAGTAQTAQMVADLYLSGFEALAEPGTIIEIEPDREEGAQ